MCGSFKHGDFAKNEICTAILLVIGNVCASLISDRVKQGILMPSLGMEIKVTNVQKSAVRAKFIDQS